MENTWAPLIRILGRYGFAMLATWGFLSPEHVTLFQTIAVDPDVVALVSVVGGALIETWYGWSKTHGGAT